MVIELLNIGRNSPWVKSLEKLHVWSLKFHKLAEMVPRYSKWEKGNYGPYTIHIWQEWPFEILWKVVNISPSKIPKLQL